MAKNSLCTNCLKTDKPTKKYTKTKHSVGFCCEQCDKDWHANCDLTWKKWGLDLDVIGNQDLTSWSAYFTRKRVGRFSTRDEAEKFLKSKKLSELIEAYEVN